MAFSLGRDLDIYTALTDLWEVVGIDRELYSSIVVRPCCRHISTCARPVLAADITACDGEDEALQPRLGPPLQSSHFQARCCWSSLRQPLLMSTLDAVVKTLHDELNICLRCAAATGGQ